MPAPKDCSADLAENDWRVQFERAQHTRRVNVVCMKWGTRYAADWVNRLSAMVRRNTSWSVRLVCFTDDPKGIRPDVECHPMPEVEFDPRIGRHWPKLGLMRKGIAGLEGMTLYIDLDVVIIGNLDPFFTFPARFCMVREWKDSHLGYGNSSVVRYFAGLESAVLDRFYATPPDVIARVYSCKEQNFLTRAVVDVTFWPDEWCPAFSHACLPRSRIFRYFARPIPPTTGRILVFFGSITPASAMLGEHDPAKRSRPYRSFRLSRHRFMPAEWIGDYWRE